MSLIKRLNQAFFVIILLSILCVGGVFWFTTSDNQKVTSTKKLTSERGAFDYRRGLTGRISLGMINGVNITEQSIVGVSKVQQDQVPTDAEKQSIAQSQIVFVGGELEHDDEEQKQKLKERLKEISTVSSGPTVLTGNLIKFEKHEIKVVSRISDIKKTLSNSFGNRFNISFGEGDIACGDNCVNGWGEVLFGKKIETKDLLFAHAFEYDSAKILLLEPEFFAEETKLKLSWLEKELSANKKEHLVVVSHDSMPGFESGSVGIAEIKTNDELASKKLFEEYKVDLVVFGDKQNFFYGKEKGVTYVSSADFKEGILQQTAGAVFFVLNFDEKNMDVFAYNEEQEVIDQFKVK